MSFPSIPDIQPVIDIDACDAMNLLLISIAMEEISLSKLMDAEREKIQFALSHRSHCGGSLDEVLQVNKSAETMLRDMIKLQMLLQFKLDQVSEMVPCTTTTTTTTTTSTTSTTTASTKCCRECYLMGTAKGCIRGSSSSCCTAPVSLYAFIPGNHAGNRTVRFTVCEPGAAICFFASGYNVRVSCVGCAQEALTVTGKGRLKVSRNLCEQQVGAAEFKLTVRDTGCGGLEYRIQLFSGRPFCFEYDSGFLSGSGCASDLRMYAP